MDICIKEWVEPMDIEIIFTEDGKVVYEKHKETVVESEGE